MTHPELAVITRLGPTIVIAGRLDSHTCSCPRRTDCEHPGAHPVDDEWWWGVTATQDTLTLAAQLQRDPHGGPAVLLSDGTAALQVPGCLQPVLRHWLNQRLEPPPPIVHSPARSFVWLQASIPRVLRRTLPDPNDLVVLGPGSWVPVPLPTEPPAPATALRWAGRPDNHPLPPADRDRLISRLLQARKTVPAHQEEK